MADCVDFTLQKCRSNFFIMEYAGSAQVSNVSSKFSLILFIAK